MYSSSFCVPSWGPDAPLGQGSVGRGGSVGGAVCTSGSRTDRETTNIQDYFLGLTERELERLRESLVPGVGVAERLH